MRRHVAAVPLSLVVCLAAGCQVKFDPPPPPKAGPAAPAAPADPPLVFSAQQLAREFFANSEAAFARYAGKSLQVEGVVHEHLPAAKGAIRAVVFQVPIVGAKRPYQIFFHFPNPVPPGDARLAPVAVGWPVILRGQLFGTSGTLITLHDCVFVGEGAPVRPGPAGRPQVAPPGPATPADQPVVLSARQLAQQLDDAPDETFRRYVPKTLQITGVVSKREPAANGGIASVLFRVKVIDRKTSAAKAMMLDCRFGTPVPPGDARDAQLAMGKRVVLRGKLTGHGAGSPWITLNECVLVGAGAPPPPHKGPMLPPAKPAGEDAQGAAAIKQLGGWVEFDKGKPDPHVVKAHLSGPKVQEADLARLGALPELRALYLSGIKITGKGLERLKGLNKLEKLNLVNCPLKDADLTPLQALPNLRALNLSQTGVTDQGLEPLRALAGLEELELLNDPITDAGLENLQGLTRLRALVLPAGPGLGVTDNGLARLKGLTELRRLYLSFNCTDKGLETVKGFGKLQRLELFGGRYTDRGLENLQGLTSLQELRLLATGVSGEGLAYLKGLPGLRRLDLDQCPMSKKGLAALKDLKGLDELGVTYAKLGDADLDTITGLTNLRVVTLSGTAITDRGLQKLAALPHLRRVSLGQTAVTEAGVRDLIKVSVYR